MIPTDWPTIARAIRVDRANNQCECRGECENEDAHGIGDGNTGGFDGGPCGTAGSPGAPITVVTLDGNRENTKAENLLAMCTPCRNAYTAFEVEAEIARRRGSTDVPLPGLGIELS